MCCGDGAQDGRDGADETKGPVEGRHADPEEALDLRDGDVKGRPSGEPAHELVRQDDAHDAQMADVHEDLPEADHQADGSGHFDVVPGSSISGETRIIRMMGVLIHNLPSHQSRNCEGSYNKDNQARV